VSRSFGTWGVRQPLVGRRAFGGRLLVWVAVAVAFVALTVLVAVHATDSLDEWVRDYFRPGDSWGRTQMRADHVVEGLRPKVVAPVLFVAAVVSSVWARSWRPAGFAVLLGGSAFVLTEATKALVSRPDPHYQSLSHSGSFPSGHTVTVLIAFGGTLLLLRPATRVWQWLIVAALGGGMGLALLIEGAHWLTDVLGAVLLSALLLMLASTSGLRNAAPDRAEARRSQEKPGRPDDASVDDVATKLQAGQS
jgi:membrane-associated PAP2 superfamily phosphatase